MHAIDVLKYGHQTVLGTIDGLAEADWTTPGGWSVKNIIARLASHEQLLVDVLYTFLSDRPTPTLAKFIEGVDQFNDTEVALRQSKTVNDVLAEYNDAHARTIVLMARIPPETRRQNGTLPWYGQEYDLEDFIAYGFYGHKREHSAQIVVFRDRLTC